MSSSKRRGRSQKRDEALEELARSCAQGPEAARARLAAGLASADAVIVQRAAELVREHGLAGLEGELSSAFVRLLEDPVKVDPGCRAKLALLEALDYLETDEQQTFLTGARYVQFEPAWRSPVDSATGVRARSIVALARIGYEDLGLLAAELLADREPAARQAAADALAHHGARANAAVLLLKLHTGDEDANVTLAVMSALLALAPDAALPMLQERLQGDDEQARELAALALGQSRRAEALAVLVAALEASVEAEERALLLRAIGLHRSERALEVLLGVVASGDAADARAALTGLAARRFEPGLRERARAAAAENERVDLSAQLAALRAEDT